MKYARMIAILAACHCHFLYGQSVKQIAVSSGKSQSTIRRWLKCWPN